MNKEPTEKQRAVLTYMQAHVRQHGAPPTLRHIANHVGVDGTTITWHMRQLEKKGFVKKPAPSQAVPWVLTDDREFCSCAHCGKPVPRENAADVLTRYSNE